MEGNAKIEPQDKTVDKRFRVLEAVDCADLHRTKNMELLHLNAQEVKGKT